MLRFDFMVRVVSEASVNYASAYGNNFETENNTLLQKN